MGRNSSGNENVGPGLPLGGGRGRGTSVSNVESLVKMRDAQLYKATKHAIARMESVLGVREREVRIADFGDSAQGVQFTSLITGKNSGIYLNKSIFNKSAANMRKVLQSEYESGWSTVTHAPLAHIVTHELGHALWNSSQSAANSRAALPEIRKLSAKWLADKNKKGYGKYAHQDLDEFWAELVTKTVHGDADKYTREVKRIVKKYKL